MDRPIGDGAQPQASAELRLGGITVRGRHFAPGELAQIRAVVEDSPQDHRFALSKKICEALDWRQPNGRVKDRACRDVLARLHDIGFLRLPPRRRAPVRRRRVVVTEETAPRPVATIRPRDIDRASLSMVTGSGDTKQERLWNEYVERYHYLGYGVPIGAHVKYFVSVQQEPIAGRRTRTRCVLRTEAFDLGPLAPAAGVEVEGRRSELGMATRDAGPVRVGVLRARERVGRGLDRAADQILAAASLEPPVAQAEHAPRHPQVLGPVELQGARPSAPGAAWPAGAVGRASRPGR
jgi:hypothetical protein